MAAERLARKAAAVERANLCYADIVLAKQAELFSRCRLWWPATDGAFKIIVALASRGLAVAPGAAASGAPAWAGAAPGWARLASQRQPQRAAGQGAEACQRRARATGAR